MRGEARFAGVSRQRDENAVGIQRVDRVDVVSELNGLRINVTGPQSVFPVSTESAKTVGGATTLTKTRPSATSGYDGGFPKVAVHLLRSGERTRS